ITTYGSSSLSSERTCCGMRSYSSSLMAGNFCAPATLVFKNGEATVNAGARSTLPKSGKTRLVSKLVVPGTSHRVAFMSLTICDNCHEAGSMNRFASPFESTDTPLKTADHAAMFVWLTDNNPRVAASFGAVVNRLNRCQSLVGWVSARPAQAIQSSSLLP